ncbi:MAG: hypothetical protein H7641_07590 [Candidatus Heimdallarchaeota archaeon]|nr:hypothetical protein [Candidatus Heimdallarchaeota archaeon]MCK4877426.1 hypothetical protein [Candidatus Heimdallarchaeota archaeon]
MNQKKFLIAIFSIFIILLLIGCTTNDTNNDSNNEDWLVNYSPVHTVGNGIDDFWVDYPSINPNSGQSVTHLAWVNDSLEKGCMLFVVHITGCVSCQPQADRIINLAEKYKEHVVFHDLDSALGGSVEKRAYDAYLYDPNGSPGIIALTGVFTLIEQNGSIVYGWHSWEQDVDFKEMEEWVKDGIYYWYENSGRIK